MCIAAFQIDTLTRNGTLSVTSRYYLRQDGWMAIPFRPPEPTAEEWAAHQLEVSRCRGGACFAALAAHYETDSPRKLEELVDRRSYTTKNGERSSSNKFRVWFRDGKTPRDDTITHVSKKTNGEVDLRYWRDLILWELLARDPPQLSRIQYLLEESFPCSIRRILFLAYDRDQFGRFHHGAIDRERTLELRDRRSLDAFLAMLCLARKGEILGDDPQHSLPTMCAFDMLPYVLHQYVPLRFSWEKLFACLDRVFFRRVYGESGAYFDFPRKRVEKGLAALETDPHAVLKPMSGLRTERKVEKAPLDHAEKKLRAILAGREPRRSRPRLI